jgi:hypothetical protein
MFDRFIDSLTDFLLYFIEGFLIYILFNRYEDAQGRKISKGHLRQNKVMS